MLEVTPSPVSLGLRRDDAGPDCGTGLVCELPARHSWRGSPRDSSVEGTGKMELGDLLPSAPSCGPPGLSPVLCAFVLGLLGFCDPSVLIPARVLCHMASVFCGLKCCLSQRFFFFFLKILFI